MAIEFAMPKLGLTMESGTILRWLVPDGAEVTAGQAVLLVETDKVETEIEASGSGVLAQTGETGVEYPCGVRIGWFLEAGEEPPAPADAAPVAAQVQAAAVPASQASPQPLAAVPVRAPGERILASPAAKRLARELGVELAVVAGTGPKGRVTERDVRAANEAPGSESAATGRPATAAPSEATPGAPTAADGPGIDPASAGSAPAGSVSRPATLAARQLADLLGVDLRRVPASAGDGRISRADVAAYVRTLLAGLSSRSADEGPASPARALPAQAAAAATAAAADASARSHTAAPPLLQTPTEQIPLRGIRGVIAERMSASLRWMAQLTLTMDVDMSAVVAERAALVEAARNDDAGGRDTDSDTTETVVPGYTDFVIAAAAAALGEHPRVNSQVTDDAVALLGDIHVGLAVALEDGLLVPVVRHADRLSLDAIAAETTRLAAGARDGTLGYDDYQGATFAVTALGMFGVDAFTPIINPPNTAILGVGRIRDETVWADAGPQPRPVLTLSLTWDHRAFDGAPAARFAGAVRDGLESR
ncbi:2-oxo acid dehydrogenase subunit E2 [Candidatus Poriferisodalis sp.]|uniref:2-oxo acid dehydrogenase subunit E2 n=1 Tax=Candidatus Poriferisodalis sp. TaxID=3101277 RepID=UPI003B01B0F1